MIIARDIAQTPESLGRDPFGVLHDGEPTKARSGQALYGDLTRRAYACGCQPVIHRFRCAACGRVFGWCYGAAGEHRWENECCNTCVVAVWHAAERCGIPLETMQAALDAELHFRHHVYRALRQIFGTP